MAKRVRTTRTGISDVAARAGVSLATVSRVMNGNQTVDAQIAERVRIAASELKYQPNPTGRNLARGKTDTIGVVVPDLGNPTFQGVLRGVSRAAAQDGYRVLIADSSEVSSEEAILAGEARRRCDGVVLCAPRMGAAELEELAPSLHPLVLVNRATNATGSPSVIVDYGRGIQDLAAHLVGLGHTRLAYVAGPASSSSHRLRLAGLDAFKASHSGIEVQVFSNGSTFEDGHSSAGDVLASGATGIMAFNDLTAMGLLSALNERGIRVPEDLSVTGFDDIPFARYTTPPLTTATVPIQDVGEQAWAQMKELLNRAPNAAAEAGEPASTTFTPTLTVRGSTAPPPGKG
ncbi:LacI family transcriptional regulator [Arthrobacter silviterrae]|uniref:LacI family transcriptional regulator n=1 Tax=Arthrobacter silviterrae TaxID=2026658 RepID=A0ABX0DH17_9MICC|nr:LacI family DNA-binding transcriptional regulator [Arthrobacter silviterrae]MDQ0277888.1 LacI family transcriptional regulator [Arthrobacter silviterrae]NGN85056.1 LacI family transcriptional regulator [Arthrobacter silviterrae]